MSGISPASAILAARHALYELAQEALADATDIDFYFGWQWPVTKPCWWAMTDIVAAIDPANIAPRRSQDETITFGVSVGAWVPGHDEDDQIAAFDRAFEILNTVQTYIRTGDRITLNDTVLWCVPGSSDSDGVVDEDGSGFVVEIAATFVCSHRIQSTS